MGIGPKLPKWINQSKVKPPYPITKNLSKIGDFAVPQGFQGHSILNVGVEYDLLLNPHDSCPTNQHPKEKQTYKKLDDYFRHDTTVYQQLADILNKSQDYFDLSNVDQTMDDF